MKIVEKNEALDGVTIDCMKKICKYYGRDYKLINIFINQIIK